MLPPATVLKWDGYTFSLDVTYTDKQVVGRTGRDEVSGNLSQDLTVIEAVRFKQTITCTGGNSPSILVVEVNVAQIPVTQPLRDTGGAGAVSAALFLANPTKYVTAGSASLHYTAGIPAGQDTDSRLDWSRLRVQVANPIRVTFLK